MILLRYALKNLLARASTSATAALGVTLVTFVLSASLMLAAGVESTLATSGRADVAIVLRKGSTSELSSVLEESDVKKVLVAAGAKTGGAESVLVLAMSKVGAPGISNVTVRGTYEGSIASRPSLSIVAGRAPRSGADEAMIGARIRGRFEGLELGKTFDLRRNRPVSIVGVFEDRGSSSESEVWMDGATVVNAFHRQGTVSAVRVELTSADAFDELRRAVESDPRLALAAEREPDYLREQSEGLATFLGIMGGVIAGFFSLGAVLGAMMTMHAAVAGRTREIGTLRALGFSRASILAAFVVESSLMAGLGGAAGALLALGLHFVKISMINYATWSELVFTFTPTPRALMTSILFGVGMGLVGGLLPAVRATRVTPLAALRQA